MTDEIETTEEATPETPAVESVEAESALDAAAEAAPAEAEAEPEAEADYSTVAAPEGVELPEGHIEGLTEWAKESGLSPEAAQAVFDRELARESAYREQVDVRGKEWLAEAKADPEIGGAKFPAAMKAAEGFIQEYGGEDLLNEFRASDYRNHPGLLRLFAKAGLANSEARSYAGGKNTPAVDPNSYEARFGAPDPSKQRRAVATS